MRKGMLAIGWIIALTLLLTAHQATAQGPGPQHTDPVWQAAYWNNADLAGSPVLWRAEANLDYNWGTGSPAPEINADHFSALDPVHRSDHRHDLPLHRDQRRWRARLAGWSAHHQRVVRSPG